MILAHEKDNEINNLNTPSGATIVVIHQWLTGWFAKQRLARHQPHDSVHALYCHAYLRCPTRIELGVIDVVMAKHVHELPGGCLGFGEIDAIDFLSP
ncbi:hypothetical protein X737_25995 [Mesorhizobium sp. L48C026A00]|nr:hypothetical protein X737_25995 [Mesorhizobium sp. L48C026A00]